MNFEKINNNILTANKYFVLCSSTVKEPGVFPVTIFECTEQSILLHWCRDLTVS